MHPLTIAYQDWLKTEEGKNCRDMSILREPLCLKFLENRIYHAFHAGAEAQAKVIIKGGSAMSYSLITPSGQWLEDPGYQFYRTARKNAI